MRHNRPKIGLTLEYKVKSQSVHKALLPFSEASPPDQNKKAQKGKGQPCCKVKIRLSTIKPVDLSP